MAGDCFECGMPAACAHHVVPKSRGGTCTVDLCGFCHAKAHHRNGNMDTRVLTKQAIDGRRKKNQLIGGIPFGFAVAADGVLVEIPDEQSVIAKIMSWHAAGLTLRAIAENLDSAGYPTKKGIGTKCTKPNAQGKVKQPSSGKWAHATVRRLIVANKRWCHSSITSILKSEKKRNPISAWFSEIKQIRIDSEDAVRQLRLF